MAGQIYFAEEKDEIYPMLMERCIQILRKNECKKTMSISSGNRSERDAGK